ncbi:MAG TPA: hypothetical protein PLK77_03815 [Pyrinomonadaceae bacterium]|nr:hypothetical protein [Pyrinomonadaceae bacterium]
MKSSISALILIAVLSITAAPQVRSTIEPPADFRSDGCTYFPDGNYRECCEIHDAEYFRGGAFRERRQSDKRLYRCVRSKKGWRNEIAAPMMYLGVRVFGASILPMPFRWGFGQPRKKK